MPINVTEIPENFSTSDLEPDLEVAEAFYESTRHRKHSAQDFSDTGTEPIISVPNNEEEQKLANDCYTEAQSFYAKLDKEEQKSTSPGAIALKLFTEKVKVLRTVSAAARDKNKEEPSMKKSVPQNSSDVSQSNTGAAQKIIRSQIDLEDEQEMEDQETESESIAKQLAPKKRGKSKKKSMTVREVLDVFGVENISLVPQRPEFTVDFISTDTPGKVAFTMRPHWIVVQSDADGTDLNISLIMDLRYKEGSRKIPRLIGKTSGNWVIQVSRGDQQIYTCQVFDSKIMRDFGIFREFVFLVID